MEAIKKDGLTWTHVSDLKYFDNEVAKIYGIDAIPQNFLVDREGRIIARNLRGCEINKKAVKVFSRLSIALLNF